MTATEHPEGPATVALFVTCVADAVVPDVAVASVRLLRSAGCEVSVPEGQTCCGQPAWNAGFVDDAAQVARTTLDALDADPADVVVVPAGSCATMVRVYWPDLFERAGDPDAAERARRVGARTRELTEHLAVCELPTAPVAGADAVAVHRSCHMERELGVTDEPTELLGRVAGVDCVPWDAADRCCGFGGTFSVKLPEVSVAMADEKLDSLPEGVRVIVGADSSCLLHLGARAEARGIPVEVRHVADVLDDAVNGAERG